MAHMTGAGIPLHPLGAKQSCTRPLPLGAHGHCAALMFGASAPSPITTNVIYYVPVTQAYCISGLAELFPQHCQVPNLTPKQHLRALTKELATTAPAATSNPKGRQLLMLVRQQLDNLLQPVAINQTREGPWLHQNKG
jgi:hypothetical protein